MESATNSMTLLHVLWDSGISPYDVVRAAGPNGKSVVQQMVQRQLNPLDDGDLLKPLLTEYLYHVLALPGSGEYAVNLLLETRERAYRPLAPRIGYLKRFQGAVIGYDLKPRTKTAEMDMNAVMQSPSDPQQDAEAMHSIQRLKNLQTLYDNELIVEEEYQMRKSQIVDELTGTSWTRSTVDEEPEIEEKLEMATLMVPQSGNRNVSESEIDAYSALNDSLKIDFIYGDADWMLPADAVKLKRESTVKCNVYIAQHCGHNVIVENRKEFGRLLGGIIAKGQMTQIDPDTAHSLEDSTGSNNAEIFF